MKKITTEIVPEHTKEKTEYFCDICGRDLVNDRSWGIYAKMVYSGDHENEEIDICERCMKTVVMPMVCSVYKIKSR